MGDGMVVGLQFLVEKVRKELTKNNFLAKLEGSTLQITLIKYLFGLLICVSRSCHLLWVGNKRVSK